MAKSYPCSTVSSVELWCTRCPVCVCVWVFAHTFPCVTNAQVCCINMWLCNSLSQSNKVHKSLLPVCVWVDSWVCMYVWVFVCVCLHLCINLCLCASLQVCCLFYFYFFCSVCSSFVCVYVCVSVCVFRPFYCSAIILVVLSKQFLVQWHHRVDKMTWPQSPQPCVRDCIINHLSAKQLSATRLDPLFCWELETWNNKKIKNVLRPLPGKL